MHGKKCLYIYICFDTYLRVLNFSIEFKTIDIRNLRMKSIGSVYALWFFGFTFTFFFRPSSSFLLPSVSNNNPKLLLDSITSSNNKVHLSNACNGKHIYTKKYTRLNTGSKRNSNDSPSPSRPLVELCTEDNKQINVVCKDSQRFIECNIDMYITMPDKESGKMTRYCVCIPVNNPVTISYHKGDNIIPIDNDAELMDCLFNFLAPAFEDDGMMLHRSPVCLTLEGNLGDDDEEDGDEYDEDFRSKKWEEYEDDDEVFNWRPDDDSGEYNKFQGAGYTVGNQGNKNEGIIFGDDEEEAIDQTTSTAYRSKSPLKPTEWNEVDEDGDEEDWDDEDEDDDEEEELDLIANFEYDEVRYSMFRILDPVLILAKEVESSDVKTPKGDSVTSWELPTEEEAEILSPIIEKLIKEKLNLES